MITEKDISKKTGKNIQSPIRMGNVSDLKIDTISFLNHFKPFFNTLRDDEYIVREKQISFLKQIFTENINDIEKLHKPYFEGDLTIKAFAPWIDQFTSSQKKEFAHLSTITRQRNISSFEIEIWDDTYFIERTQGQVFEQNVNDFRIWKRTFKQASKEAVDNELFYSLLKKIASLIKEIHPKVRKLQITSHFMRTISQEQIKGENSPEGVHEDGSQYIMSALVVNRENINGAESQIYEKDSLGSKKIIFQKILEPGEFLFQADTGEEFTFGNDLWHYVTPIEPRDISNLGIRDIIGFDIDILH